MTMRVGNILFWAVCIFIQQSSGLTLHFQYQADDGTGLIAADDFYAVGRPDAGISDGFDALDLRKPPALPANSTRMQNWADPAMLIGDVRYLDTALPNKSWAIQLALFQENPSENIVHTLKLLDAVGLADLPAGTLIYLRRYDAQHQFAAYYDLTEPANHTIMWQTDGDPSGSVDLAVVYGCIRADADNSGSVDLRDFAQLAEAWMRNTVSGTADVNGNNRADMADIVIIAQHWLTECQS